MTPDVSPCKKCGSAPALTREDGHLHIQCESAGCVLMFNHGYGDMTEAITIMGWNRMMDEYGKEWSA